MKFFEPSYKINYETFETVIDDDGRVMLDEDFTATISEFKEWCQGQEKVLKDLFISSK